MEAAVVALQEVGFAGATAREIADRAGCHQSQVFYYFGSVNGLLLAALDSVSQRRLSLYRTVLSDARQFSDLIDGAQRLFAEDLDSGNVAVLVQLIAGAETAPELAGAVREALAPWISYATDAAELGINMSPFGPVIPADQLGYALAAGLLGLEILAALYDDRQSASDLFDHAQSLARMASLAGPLLQLRQPPSEQGGSATDDDAS